ncbi:MULTISPECIES: helix-turn-helix domain-containing protein [Flavobacteriaceae]|uniref:helix-turn-helix domain-containing protein n=1 Tax=Flavobacteriaceae TaxID=49546 RepID=UPI002FFC6F8F
MVRREDTLISSGKRTARNYFGKLTKNETGKSAKDHIQDYMIEIAKKKIFNTEKSMSGTAYELSFKYPQHFNCFFKNKWAIAPMNIEC